MLMYVDLNSLGEGLTICSAGYARIGVRCVVTAMGGVITSVGVARSHEGVRKLQDLLTAKSST